MHVLDERLAAIAAIGAALLTQILELYALRAKVRRTEHFVARRRPAKSRRRAASFHDMQPGRDTGSGSDIDTSPIWVK